MSLSLQTPLYVSLPPYSSSPIERQLEDLEHTARNRRNIIRPIAWCLCPVTCSIATSVTIAAGVAYYFTFGCCCNCCDTVSLNSIITKITPCDVPLRHRCGLIFSPCLPCVLLTDCDEDYLLPPERQEMETVKQKVFSLQILKALSIFNALSALPIRQLIVDYCGVESTLQLEPVPTAVTFTSERDSLQRGGINSFDYR